jgi:PHD/YefM family antitoxin component YafN of YafNO toxin-antitoxin module
VGALLPPSPDDLEKAATDAYRPFDVIDRFVVPFGSTQTKIEIRPLVAFDDAHALHPTQFRNLSRWLVRRELRVARWVLTRLDVLPPDEAIGVILAGNSGEVELPGITTAREITQITLQSTQDRRGQRSLFRRMAKDMANRYLAQMAEFSTRKLVSLDSLLPNEPEHITAAKVSDLRNKVDSTQKRLRITKERRASLLKDVEAYEGTGLGEDDQLAMLAILMHRYAKRIPQTGLFSEDADPDPSRPLAVDSSVFEAARLHLFHSYGRPYYFGIDDLCDASSENAEQFLRLAAILVEAIATRLIRGRPASLRSDEQDRLLRERAASFIKDWNFPQFDYVRTLVDLIAKQCLAVSLEPNAWIGAGANAYGVLQAEFERVNAQEPDLGRTLKYAVAYNAITLVPQYECKNKIWCLLELGGIPKLQYGLTLKRGGFIEGTLSELASYNRNTA